MAGDAKVHINLRAGTFEVEGSEDFVKAQLEAYDTEIRQSLATAPAAAREQPADGGEDERNGGGDGDGGQGANTELDEFANVLEVVGDKVRILKKVPGQGKKGKMRQVALLYLLAAELGGRNESVPTVEIRQACQDQGCLDGKNFSAALKAEHGNIVVEGNVARLTVPGRYKAKELASELKQS